MSREIRRRATRQKAVILRELCKVKNHPTADMIFRMARRRLPNISFGTVYRNLSLLKEEGKVLELSSGRYSCRYDATVDNHYHFVCNCCGEVIDIDSPVLKGIDEMISRKSGMRVDYHRMDFFGACGSCKAGNGKGGRPWQR